jgi:hypothetical protein
VKPENIVNTIDTLAFDLFCPGRRNRGLEGFFEIFLNRRRE